MCDPMFSEVYVTSDRELLDGGNRSFKYTIQIGSRKVAASTERTVAIDGLSLNKTHLIKVLRDGKLIESLSLQLQQKG
jgi:hypothetical protein